MDGNEIELPKSIPEYAAAVRHSRTPARKSIPIGSGFQVIADGAGKQKVNPKRKAMGTATEIARRKKRRWMPAK